ncbi:hypothetical protein [Hyalangium gracile]|uniref:hypothetical protein n=1 Tax=Hyalangium gracile TaxID=394092 RepID=UPI001CCE0794|nr:hypothetical protein [Hyalangium gracile]
MRSGATHFQERQLPPPGHPVRQFFHGLSLPFHLHRALWADPAARRRYVRVGIVQSVVILALALTCKGSATEAVDTAQESWSRTEKAKARKQERENFKLAVQLAAEELAREPQATGQRAGEETPAPVEKEVHQDIARAAEALARAAQEVQAAQAAQEAAAARAAVEQATEAQAELEAEEKPLGGFRLGDLEFWAALFATLQIASWVVIALSREYHDAISRDASLLTGLEPEDPPGEPRIRLNLKWVRKKFSRRVRAFLVFLTGLPVLYALSAPLPFRTEMASVLISGWSAYWLVVFTTAKTAHAWRDTDAGHPWFLRAWNRLTTRVPGFRWSLLQRYGRFWENRTRSVFAPAVEAEKLPWAFAGLAVIRALAMIPILKCFLRPLIPVAAAHLLVARRIADGASVAEANALPAPTPAGAAGPEA